MMKDTVKVAFPNMIAHRGLSGLERENTAAAFVAAGQRNVVGIETDIHRTVDGKFVCIHNDSTGAVSAQDLVVCTSTLEELRALELLDLTGKPRCDLRIPTLEEYIRICQYYEKIAVVELKPLFSEAELMEIVDMIRALGWLDHTIFIAFGLENLVTIRRMLPAQPLQYLRGAEKPEQLMKTLQEYHLDLDVHYESMTEAFVKEMHDAGIKINCWTVDHPQTAQRLQQLGVDYITSNILESCTGVDQDVDSRRVVQS